MALLARGVLYSTYVIMHASSSLAGLAFCTMEPRQAPIVPISYFS